MDLTSVPRRALQLWLLIHHGPAHHHRQRRGGGLPGSLAVHLLHRHQDTVHGRRSGHHGSGKCGLAPSQATSTVPVQVQPTTTSTKTLQPVQVQPITKTQLSQITTSNPPTPPYVNLPGNSSGPNWSTYTYGGSITPLTSHRAGRFLTREAR